MSEAQMHCDNCGDLTLVSQIQTAEEDGENKFLCPQCWNRRLEKPDEAEGASQPTAAQIRS